MEEGMGNFAVGEYLCALPPHPLYFHYIVICSPSLFQILGFKGRVALVVVAVIDALHKYQAVIYFIGQCAF